MVEKKAQGKGRLFFTSCARRIMYLHSSKKCIRNKFVFSKPSVNLGQYRVQTLYSQFLIGKAFYLQIVRNWRLVMRALMLPPTVMWPTYGKTGYPLRLWRHWKKVRIILCNVHTYIICSSEKRLEKEKKMQWQWYGRASRIVVGESGRKDQSQRAM